MIMNNVEPENHMPVKSQFLLYTTPDGKERIEVRLENETVWLSQIGMAELFQTTPANINIHLKNIYGEGELRESAIIKEYLIVREEGKRRVKRCVRHYNLEAILSVAKEVADNLALEQYKIFDQHRLTIEAEQEMLEDDKTLKAIEKKVEKRKHK